MTKIQPTGNAWFRSGFGRWLAMQERRIITKMVRDVFGIYGVQLGGEQSLLRASPLRYSLLLGRQRGGIHADWRELPFETDSLDLLLLVHALEATTDPRAVLREAARALRPEGRIIIVGFNPWSLLALDKTAPWRDRRLSVTRLKDWLALLELQPQGGEYAAFLPPWKMFRHRRLRWIEKAGRRWWPLAGGVFFLHAVKRRYGMRIILPNFKRPLNGLPEVGVERKAKTADSFVTVPSCPESSTARKSRVSSCLVISRPQRQQHLD